MDLHITAIGGPDMDDTTTTERPGTGGRESTIPGRDDNRQRAGSGGSVAENGQLGDGDELCPGCAAVPLPDPYDLYCPACWEALK